MNGQQMYVRSHWGRANGLNNNISWGRAYLAQQLTQLAQEYARDNGFEFEDAAAVCYMNTIQRSPVADEGRVLFDEMAVVVLADGFTIEGRECMIDFYNKRI